MSPEFMDNKGPLRLHSTRKLASTWARKNGASKDEKDIHRHWKGKGRVLDVYDDVELPYPDTKVAAILCPGGACKYVVKENSAVTSDFILQHVVPI